VIPGLKVLQHWSDNPAIRVHLGCAPCLGEEVSDSDQTLTYCSASQTESGNPDLQMWRICEGEFSRVDYADGTQFWINRDASELWAAWPENLAIEDVASYLLGPIFGLMLRLQGTACLHASAVALGDSTAAFVGPPGAGKSTTAAALAQRGFTVLSDDIVVLIEHEETFFTVPSYPYLSLWPESVEMLYGDSDALPRFVPSWEKRRLALDGDGHFEDRERTLAAIYLFGDRRSDLPSRVEEIDARTALLMLIPNTYATNALDARMRAEEFQVLGRLVERVPIRRLLPRADRSSIGALCELIRTDFQGLVSSDAKAASEF
jgi:hypothetical protein